jgi:hypothetical protein
MFKILSLLFVEINKTGVQMISQHSLQELEEDIPQEIVSMSQRVP